MLSLKVGSVVAMQLISVLSWLRRFSGLPRNELELRARQAGRQQCRFREEFPTGSDVRTLHQVMPRLRRAWWPFEKRSHHMPELLAVGPKSDDPRLVGLVSAYCFLAFGLLPCTVPSAFASSSLAPTQTIRTGLPAWLLLVDYFRFAGNSRRGKGPSL
jgi:hypothetical protein